MVESDVSAILKTHIRAVMDYPNQGIAFKDITPLLGNAEVLSIAVDAIIEPFQNKTIDIIAGIEARGFILGSAIASKFKLGFIPIRKAGKLPYKTIAASYALEYGEDRLEVHKDAIAKGQNVLLIDDLIATGGTAMASVDLLSQLDAHVVGAAFLIDLPFLNGSNKLKDKGIFVHSVIQYDIAC